MGYVARRAVYSLLVIVLASLVTFAGLRITPGDVTTQVIDPTRTPEQVVQELRERLGLDQPFLVQYGNYVRDLAQGDLGESLVNGQPVTSVIAASAGYTILLAGAAFVLTFVIGIALGVASARRRGSWVDRAILGLAGLLMSIPNFVLAMILILVVAVQLEWLPVSGAGSWQHLVLPAVVLAAEPAGLVIRMVRSSMLGQMHADYVRTLRSRGVGERAIRWKHVLRNALTPVISLGAVQMRTLLGYTLIVEVIFRWPGLGSRLVESVLSRDYPVAQSLAILMAVVVVLSTLAADGLYRLSDPRVRVSGVGV